MLCAVGLQLVVEIVAMSYSSLKPSEAYNHHTERLRISRYQVFLTTVGIRGPDSPLPWRSKTARLRARCPGRRALGGNGGLPVNMAATTLGVYCRLCERANSLDTNCQANLFHGLGVPGRVEACSSKQYPGSYLDVHRASKPGLDTPSF